MAAEDPATRRMLLLVVPVLPEADVQALSTVLMSIDFR